MRLVYIDENGNEIPVSGRPTSAENLPLEAGSQVMTKEAIDGKAGKTEIVTFTPETGVTAAYISTGKIDKLVSLTAEIRFSGNANTWTTLGTISPAPIASQLGVPAVNTSNGTLMGILQIKSTGEVKIYPTSTQSNGSCGFSISYRTA